MLGICAQTFVEHLMKLYLKAVLLTGFAALCFSTHSNADQTVNIDISQTFKWNSQSIDQLATNAAHVVKQNCSANCTLTLRVFVARPIGRVGLKKIDRLHREILKKMDGFHGGLVQIVDSIHLI